MAPDLFTESLGGATPRLSATKRIYPHRWGRGVLRLSVSGRKVSSRSRNPALHKMYSAA